VPASAVFWVVAPPLILLAAAVVLFVLARERSA